MKQTSIVMLTIFFLISTVVFCLADEEKDHVCFRELDANRDDLVTLQEFEKFYENDRNKFNDADLDEDGKLTHEEYHNILGHGSE